MYILSDNDNATRRLVLRCFVQRPSMEEGPMADEQLPRRRFLLNAGSAAVAAGLAPALPAQAQQPAATTAAPAPEPESYLTLTAVEAAFFSAAADTMIPADSLTPSGTDC